MLSASLAYKSQKYLNLLQPQYWKFLQPNTNTTNLTILMPDLLFNDMIPQKELTMKFYNSANYSSLLSQNLKFSLFHIIKRALTKFFGSFRSKVWSIERKTVVIIGLRHCQKINEMACKVLPVLFSLVTLLNPELLKRKFNADGICLDAANVSSASPPYQVRLIFIILNWFLITV